MSRKYHFVAMLLERQPEGTLVEDGAVVARYEFDAISDMGAMRAAQAWRDVDALIAQKTARAYDEAASLLMKLRDLAIYQHRLPEFQASWLACKRSTPSGRSCWSGCDASLMRNRGCQLWT